MKKNWFVLLVFVFLSGCASKGPSFSPITQLPDNKGLVYIYRSNDMVGGGISYTVHANEEPVVKLKRGGYYPYFSDAGEVEFWAKTEAKSLVALDVEVGETYFVKGKVGVGLLVGRPKLSIPNAYMAKDEILKCKLLPPKKKKKAKKSTDLIEEN